MPHEPDDVVIDTNVFVHTSNPEAAEFEAARELVQGLLESRTLLCFDEGAHPKEASNRSKILSEYYTHIDRNSVGYYAVAQLLSNGRMKQVSPRVPERVRNIVGRAVHDPTDRIFVRVAHISAERILVSHDHQGFTPKCKTRIAKQCSVYICTAADMLER